MTREVLELTLPSSMVDSMKRNLKRRPSPFVAPKGGVRSKQTVTADAYLREVEILQ